MFQKIMDRFIDEGVRIDSIIALGGVAKKSHFILQRNEESISVNWSKTLQPSTRFESNSGRSGFVMKPGDLVDMGFVAENCVVLHF